MGRRYYGRRRRNIGYERARQHIADAHRLSHELGGSDEDVKQYFFSLSAYELSSILEAYEDEYGQQARSYAEQTLPKWRSGSVTMSGTVAERLFALLPPRMTLQIKLKLTEKLWRHFGPSSRKAYRIGLDAGIEDVVGVVMSHMEEVVVGYAIPSNLERRFDWLSGGDVSVKQQILNYFRQLEKNLVADAVRAQWPVMVDHFRNGDGRGTQRLAQILKVHKHEVELVLEPKASGISEIKSSTAAGSSSSDAGCTFMFWLVAGAFVLWLLFGKR